VRLQRLSLPLLLIAGALALPAPGTAWAVGDGGAEVMPAASTGLEALRAWVRATTVGLARGVDSWFGQRPFDDGGRVEQGRLEVRTSWRRDQGPEASLRLDARFELPNLRERVYAFLGRDVERDVVVDKPAALSRQERVPLEPERASYFLGLAWPLGEHVELRAGLGSALEPYAQARYAQAWTLGEHLRLDVRETVFWTDADGIGSTTAVAFARALSPALELRWLNAATVARKRVGAEWSSLLGLYRVFGPDRELAGEALMAGHTASEVSVDEYGLQLRWRQRVYRDWLIGEFTLGHFWPRPAPTLPRESAWALGVAVLLRF